MSRTGTGCMEGNVQSSPGGLEGKVRSSSPGGRLRVQGAGVTKEEVSREYAWRWVSTTLRAVTGEVLLPSASPSGSKEAPAPAWFLTTWVVSRRFFKRWMCCALRRTAHNSIGQALRNTLTSFKYEGVTLHRWV